MVRHLAAFAFTSLCAAAAGPPQAYDLLWKPTAGEVHTYRLSMHLDFHGSPLDVKADVKSRVVSVRPDGSYDVQTSSANGTMTSPEGSAPVEKSEPTVESFDRHGVPAKKPAANEEDPFADLLDLLTQFRAPTVPVKVGMSWTVDQPGPRKGAPKVPITYKLQSVGPVEGHDAAKVSYVVKRSLGDAEASGTILLSAKSFALVRLDAKIPYFRPEGASEDASVELHYIEVVAPKG